MCSFVEVLEGISFGRERGFVVGVVKKEKVMLQ